MAVEYTNTFGLMHREDDKPAYVDEAKEVWEWYKNGRRHRDGDKPAIIRGNMQAWCQHNRMHRDGDMPACICDDGTLEWYCNGLLHRDGDKPAVVTSNGQWQYWTYGRYHRTVHVTCFGDGSHRHAFVTAVRHLSSEDAETSLATQRQRLGRASSLLTQVLTDTVRFCIQDPACDHRISSEYALLVALFL